MIAASLSPNHLLEAELLKKKNNSFNVSVEELLSGICTHKDKERANSSTMTFDPNTGYCRCVKCKSQFHSMEITVSREEIEKRVNSVIDILENIKVLDCLDDESLSQYYTLIPFLKKIPEVFDYAVKNFDKWENEHDQKLQDQCRLEMLKMFGGANDMFYSGIPSSNKLPD